MRELLAGQTLLDHAHPQGTQHVRFDIIVLEPGHMGRMYLVEVLRVLELYRAGLEVFGARPDRGMVEEEVPQQGSKTKWLESALRRVEEDSEEPRSNSTRRGRETPGSPSPLLRALRAGPIREVTVHTGPLRPRAPAPTR